MADLLTSKSEPNERRWNKNENSVLDTKSNSRKSFIFTIFDLAVLVLSVLSIFIDLCTDLVLVFQYNSQGYKAWAVGTFALIFLPSIIVQFFSLRWHIIDKTASLLHWVLHFCMLGIIERYFQIIKSALVAYKSKNASDIEKVFFDQSDLCMLHLFESFLESAPQLVLQMYVIAVLHEWRFWTGVSVLASLLSLAWALAAYTKAQRRARANKNSTTWPGLLLQAIWRTGMLTARISTLVLGAYCFGNYFFLIIIIHWIAMTVWIICQKTDFCETYWEEKVYNAVVGVIYCFCFFNLQEGQSRWRALAFYLVIIFQNLTCLTIFLMWFGEKTPKLAVSGFVAIIGGTLLGSTSMLCYYRYFHPSGPIKFVFAHTQPVECSPYSTMTLRSLKKIRCESPKDASHKSPPKTDSENILNKTAASDSVVIVEESVLDETDPEITMLKNWANDNDESKPVSVSNKNEATEAEADAYKRRPICSSVDLDKLIESEGRSLKGTDEASSEVLSAHDYENLCAVNIAREVWGLRSWRGYSDIETWLHDDSVVHDRRLDTLTSTTSSDRSANTFQKESDRTRQDDYMDAIAEDLAQCESEGSSDYVLAQYSIESLPVVYPLGTLDPIFEEIEPASNNSLGFADDDDLKMRNGSASTLVATIDEIRRNTPVQNRYPQVESIYDGFSPLRDIKPRLQRNWKKVTFASKLLTFPEEDLEKVNNLPKAEEPNRKHQELPENHQEKTKIKMEEKNILQANKELNIPIKRNITSESKNMSNLEICNKENIPTVASKINYWNKILSSQNEKMLDKNVRSSQNVTFTEKKSAFLVRVLTPPNFPTFQRRKKISGKLGNNDGNT